MGKRRSRAGLMEKFGGATKILVDDPRGSTRLAKYRQAVAGLILLAATVVGLSAEPAGASQAPGDELADSTSDGPALSARYQFREQYDVVTDATRPLVLGQYQVATRETTKITQERPQGAPVVDQTVLQSIYTDRVAKLNADGSVAEVVRRYDRVKLDSTVRFTAYKTKWLEGLTILYRLGKRITPQILSLSDRQLRQQEFEHISMQTFMPSFSTVLPRRPARVGDTWPVSRTAVWSLIGEVPSEEGFEVEAELREIRKDDQKATMTAVIDVKGDFVLAEGPSALNAQIYFQFPAPEAAGSTGGAVTKDQPAAPKPGDRRAVAAATTDARGFISKVRMGQSITMIAPDTEGRLKQTIARSLVLDRRLSAGDAQDAQPVTVPNPMPAPAIENAWLLYDDPRGRFHLLYPQEFRVAKVYADGGIDLFDPRPDGRDVIQVNLVPKAEDPQRDRLAADPFQEKKMLEEEWRKRGEKVLPGPSGWLPEADWAASKKKVYRIEAALVPELDSGPGPAPASGRIYLDRYIVQFPRSEVIRVTAMTTRDPHVPFRDLTESLIKTFNFGASEGAVPASPGEPAGSSRPAPPR